MAKCCKDHSVPILIAAEYRVDQCAKCGTEHIMLYAADRLEHWQETGANPVDEAMAHCAKRFPEARPRVKR